MKALLSIRATQASDSTSSNAAGKALRAGFIAALVTLAAAAGAQPNDILVQWSTPLERDTIKFNLDSRELDPTQNYVGSFTVPMPTFEISSGQAAFPPIEFPVPGGFHVYDYNNTTLSGFRLDGVLTNGGPFSVVIPIGDNYGRLTLEPVTTSQAVSFDQLSGIATTSDWVITAAYAVGNHVYLIPEPSSYALMFAGLAALAWLGRRHRALRAM
jgi:hypothetical protein